MATVGTVLPGDFKIKKSKIRGVESVGMICSVRELDLGDEHDGIWVLPDVDGAPAPIGAPLAEALGLTDWVIEIDNKSLTHRPDLWGHRGIAREVAAIFERDLKPLDLTLPEIGGGAPFLVAVEDAACSRYLGLAIDGAENGMAPDWMRSLLLAVGQRPIDLLVDLSNFVMLDLGQPNHAFDRGALAAGGIVVRKAPQVSRSPRSTVRSAPSRKATCSSLRAARRSPSPGSWAARAPRCRPGPDSSSSSAPPSMPRR